MVKTLNKMIVHGNIPSEMKNWDLSDGSSRVLLVLITLFLFSDLARTAQLAVMVFNPQTWFGGQTPSGWQIKVNHGKPIISSCNVADTSCLDLKSVKSSFALEREVDVDPYQTRYLTWRWRVAQLPDGGDFRHSRTDDQAAQVMVGFSDRRVVSYIWDTTAPKGTMQSASSSRLVHIFAVVCESGAMDVNRWLPETRDVAADYERAYGKTAPHVKGLRIQINSQHTGTMAESSFGEVVFRNKSE
jgi:hypothetical protein